ncbi:C40 family peptidase [Hymenobacter sp. BT507]|uniref:C40 family peptidase n=1 Tax=Hymenobacter citatus TaxID=2763506 RepID=A0ABR7MF02_9BACT|nr:C40 family peptidase [Hymenobacter citatus]MBC6609661.1 C40 family peptidase [Hymenobacter citatus]
MRYVWITFLSLVAVLLAVFLWPRQPDSHAVGTAPTSVAPVVAVVQRTYRAPTPALNDDRAEAIIDFARQQLGTRYCYAGTTPAGGFDCSGFVYYVFKQFDISVPHSTAQLISTGRPVERSHARPGDIVVFTGTAATSTTPGHAGIVLSEPGEPLRFIHSSSARRESGVKISQVEGSDYERRFMQVRRVL